MARRPFAFCPFCATPLQDLHLGHKLLRSCPHCGFVQHHDPKVAVIARIEHAGCLLLVRRGVNPAKGLWSLPGGYMDADELPPAALQREIREELDMAITVHELLDIYPMVNAETSQGIVLAYRATPADPQLSVAVPPQALDDVAEARWFTAHEFAGALPVELAFASTAVEVRRWVQLAPPSKESQI